MSNKAKCRSFKTELSKLIIIIHSIWFFMNLFFDLYISNVYEFDLEAYAPAANFLKNIYGYLLFEAIVIAILITVFALLKHRVNLIAATNEKQLFDTVGFSLILAYIFSIALQYKELVAVAVCFVAFLLGSYYQIKSIRLVSLIGAVLTVILSQQYYKPEYLNSIENYLPLIIVLITIVILKKAENNIPVEAAHEDSFLNKFGGYLIFTASALFVSFIALSFYMNSLYNFGVYVAHMITTPLKLFTYTHWSWKILCLAISVIVFLVFKNIITRSTNADDAILNSAGYILILTAAIQFVSKNGINYKPYIIFAFIMTAFYIGRHIRSKTVIILLVVYLFLLLIFELITIVVWNFYAEYKRIIIIIQMINSALPFIMMIICGIQVKQYSKTKIIN